MVDEILFEGLCLRPWKEEDVEIYLQLIQGKSILKNLRNTMPCTKEMFAAFVGDKSVQNGVYHYAIEKERQIIGGITFSEESDNRIELGGFWIAEKFREQGLGKKVTKALMEYVSRKYQGYTIFVRILSFNQGPINIVTSLGFEYREDLNDEIPSRGKSVLLLYYEIRN